MKEGQGRGFPSAAGDAAPGREGGDRRHQGQPPAAHRAEGREQEQQSNNPGRGVHGGSMPPGPWGYAGRRRLLRGAAPGSSGRCRTAGSGVLELGKS